MGTHERYFDCVGHEILPRCKDNEIILRDGEGFPQCIAIAPPQTYIMPILVLALVVGILVGRFYGLNSSK